MYKLMVNSIIFGPVWVRFLKTERSVQLIVLSTLYMYILQVKIIQLYLGEEFFNLQLKVDSQFSLSPSPNSRISL